MLISDFLFMTDFDPYVKFLVHFEDLDFTDLTDYGSLSKYWDCEILSFSYDSSRKFVLDLRCPFDE